MINLELYENIYKKITQKYKLSDIQIVTSDLLLLSLLVYIQDKFSDKEKLNIFYIRKNRVKTWKLSKIEWKINSKKILLIENIILDSSNISYIEKSLELHWRKIDYIFAPILNDHITLNYNINYYNLSDKDININKYTEKLNINLVFKSHDQNISNLYKKNYIQEHNWNLIFIDDMSCLYFLDSKYTIKWKLNLNFSYDSALKPIIIKEYIYVISSDWILYKILYKNWKIIEKKSICDYVKYNMCYSFKTNEIIIFWINSSTNNKYSIFFVNIADLSCSEIFIWTNISSDPIILDNKLIFSNEMSELIIYDFQWFITIPINWNIIWGIENNNNLLYFSTDSGLVQIFDLKLNHIILTKKISDYWLLSKPLYINKRLYVGSVDKKMYILNDKLDTIWSIDTLWRIFSSPVLINNNLICFGSNDSRLYTYNITTEQINYFQMSERIISKPILFNNKLVIQDFLNNIYSIDL